MKLYIKKITLTISILLFYIIFIYFSPFKKHNEEINVIKDEYYEPKDILESNKSINNENFSFLDLKDDTLDLENYKKDIEFRLRNILDKKFNFNIKYNNGFIYTEILEENKLKKIYLENFQNNNVEGYAGKIFLGVFINNDEKIETVNYIISNETPSYLYDIKRKGFYENFSNLYVNKNYDIDIISGATLTCTAINNSVNEIIKTQGYIVENYYSTRVSDFHINSKINKIWIVHISIISILFIVLSFFKIKKTKKIKLFVAVFTLIYIGFILNNSFTYISFIHPLLGFSISLYLTIYSLLILLSCIWSKNTYCQYICPFGSAQYLIVKISPFKKTKFLSNKTAHIIRYSVSFTLITGFLLGLEKWKNYELFPDLFSLNFKSYYFFISLIVIFISMKFPMIWCRITCPTGCLLDSISKISKNT